MRILAVVAICTCMAAVTFAAGAQVEVSMDATPQSIHVGDPVALEITVLHPPDTRVIFNEDNLSLEPFQLLDRTRFAEDMDDGRIKERIQLTISAYETGQLEIPSVTIPYETADGTSGEISTDSVWIDVNSILTDTDQAPRGFKGPAAVQPRLKYKLYHLLAFLVLAAAAAGAVWIMRRRMRRPVTDMPDSQPVRPAHEIALEALDELEQKHLLLRGEIKAFYVAAIEILKRYIGHRYAIPTLERTTEEIRSGLYRAEIREMDCTEILQFLTLADLVKFARYRPEEHQSAELIPRLRRFVERTRDVAVVTGETAGESREDQIA